MTSLKFSIFFLLNLIDNSKRKISELKLHMTPKKLKNSLRNLKDQSFEFKHNYTNEHQKLGRVKHIRTEYETF